MGLANDNWEEAEAMEGLTDLRRLAARQLGEEVGVLVGLVARPGRVGVQGILEVVLWSLGELAATVSHGVNVRD